jgi:hypothetical protein
LKWERLPLEKGGVPMGYVTYDNLIQMGLFLVALIGLVYKISHKDE